MLVRPLTFLNVSFLISLYIATLSTADRDDHFLNQFAIQLKSGGRDVAETIAKQHGFVVSRELQSTGTFLLEHPNVRYRSKRNAQRELDKLASDSRVKHAHQEIALNRVKRNILYDKQLEIPTQNVKDDSVFARFARPKVTLRDNVYGISMTFEDPKFNDMWYLINQGQSGGEQGMDMNIAVVWENGYTGKGVVVCILDDGIDHTHPDLLANYDPQASMDLNDKSDDSDDPMPDTLDKDNSHGTRCAGEIAAAANNDICGVGIAYEASIGGVRILDGTVTDALEAEALRFNANYIDIYSASWGPNDDGATMEGPRRLALEALQDGVRFGRNGLGSIFVWATGNGGMNQDDCNADGYVSRPETLSVGSVNERGMSPFFMENCTSTFAVVPSGGEEYSGQEETENQIKLKVITTDLNGGCIENFQGTSSAAPLAAGCLANVLQANPNLTWRDVQHIIVRGSRVPSADTTWQVNGAGYHVSHRFGFGLMDCGKMVQLAQSWSAVPEQIVCNRTRQTYQILKNGGEIQDIMMIYRCGENQAQLIDRLEHVQVHIKMSSKRRGDISVSLMSPAGTRSVLLSTRPKDDHEGEWEFTFMSVHHWDENPRGKWSLQIMHNPLVEPEDSDVFNDRESTLGLGKPLEGSEAVRFDTKQSNEHVGFIENWSLILYGTRGARHDRTHTDINRMQKAFYPSKEHMALIKSKEYDISRKVQVKRAGPGPKREIYRTSSSSIKTDELLVNLWNSLHTKGSREIRKRINSAPETSPFYTARFSDINHLADELISMLGSKSHRDEDGDGNGQK